MTTKTKQYAAYTAIGLWAMLSFLFLCGDDAPGHESSLAYFIITKGIALLSLLACIKAGAALRRRGYFPELSTED